MPSKPIAFMGLCSPSRHKAAMTKPQAQLPNQSTSYFTYKAVEH